jgi:transcriptional regulator with XRE-family HTH domain
MNFMTDSINSSLGDRVRRARKSRGFGLPELGYAVGMTYDQLCRCERGDERFSTLEVFRIARVLRMNPVYLLGAEAPRSKPPRRPAGAPANDNDHDGERIVEIFGRMMAELAAAVSPQPPPARPA